MPELPEVETTRRGLEPHLRGQQVIRVVVRQPKLRWPVPAELAEQLPGQRFLAVRRRGKYLLLETPVGTLIGHLGMSGSLRIVAADAAPGPHDHLDIWLESGQLMRYTDPRRFGAMLWTVTDPFAHPLLAGLGPEPLSAEFDGGYLYRVSRGRSIAVKSLVMNSHVVVGVGNIYANEALFQAGIHPKRGAGRIGLRRYQKLSDSLKQVLQQAIAVGGTTLRDFVGGEGQPGYFKQSLRVYGRAAQPCVACGEALREIRLAQRSTIYCPGCQH